MIQRTSTSAEALAVSEDLLADLELSRMPLANCFMKGLRLARLLGDPEMLQILRWELSGYPSTPSGIPADAFNACIKAGRVATKAEKDAKLGTEKEVQRAYTEPIESLEAQSEIFKTRLGLAQDNPVSISSANPNQFVHSPMSNAHERNSVAQSMKTIIDRIASRRAFLYNYVLERNLELRVSGAASDVFDSRRAAIDQKLGAIVPTELQRISSISSNLESENPEDWANAVHSCRRLLQGLADALYPPREPRTVGEGKKAITVQLGADNYINRLIAFAEDASNSQRSIELVGSNLHYLGDRLDAAFQAAQKGSHADVTLAEAQRFVVYTYLLVGDLIELREIAPMGPARVQASVVEEPDVSEQQPI